MSSGGSSSSNVNGSSSGVGGVSFSGMGCGLGRHVAAEGIAGPERAG